MVEDFRRRREQLRQALGRKIRRLRIEKGWNASELARQAGLTRDNISTYERASSLPTEDSLKKLARALGVEPGDLLPAKAAHHSAPTYPPFEMVVLANGRAMVRLEREMSIALAAKVLELHQSEPLPSTT